MFSAFGSKQQPDSVGPFHRYNFQVEGWEWKGRLSETRPRRWRSDVFWFYFRGLVWIFMDRIGGKGFGASDPFGVCWQSAHSHCSL